MGDERDHASRELMQRFFRAELSRRDTREVVRHLLARCPECLDTAHEIGRMEGFTWEEADLHRSLLHKNPNCYNESFLRVLRNADELEAALAREKLRGIGLWACLEKHPHERRLLMIRNDPRMQCWGLYEQLLEKTREAGFSDPAEAVNIARLALAVVAELDPGHYGEERIADFRAAALGALGNAQRLASDFSEAESAFRQARESLSGGTGDPLEKATLISLEASLLKDLGEFEQAVRLMDQAISIYRELNDRHLEGRTLLQQSATIGFVRPEIGVKLAESGLALIDALREPRLELCGRHTLAWLLNDAGQPREALVMLELSRPVYAQFDDVWTHTRLHWLEGRIARNLGDLVEAEETFQRLWLDLQEPSYAHELTLLSLDLAEVYVARGKHDDASQLVAEFLPMLRSWGMHAEGLAMWLLLQKAVQTRTAHGATFRSVAEYMYRAWYRPLRDRMK
jgi:tetratricopeptide (TPR) repeat protein